MAASAVPSEHRSSSEQGRFDKATAEIPSSSSSTMGPTAKQPEEDQYPGPFKLALVMIAVFSSVLVAALDQTIVATAIPRITAEFQGLDKISWYGSAYFLTSAGTTPFWGKIFRYFPLKSAYLTGLFIFEVGSLICGVAPNADALIIGRAIAGIGCGGMITGTFMLMTFAMPPKTRPIGFSSVVTIYGVAAACGPLIGGAFTGHVTWRWCFYINLPIGALTVAAILFSPKLAHAKTVDAPYLEILKQLDLFGVVLLMGAIISIILALQFGGQSMPWNSATVIGLLIGFGLILAAFAAWQAYLGEVAVLVPRLMKLHSVWAMSSFQAFFAGSYFTALYYLPVYFQAVLSVGPTESGVRNLPLVLTVCLVSIPTGQVLGRWPHAKSWFQTVCSALVAITCGLFYTLDENTSTGEWIGFQILGGAAWASAWQVSILTAQGGKDVADLPLATSTVNLMQFLGGAIGLSIAQTLFNNRLISALADFAPGVDPEVVLHTGATELRTAFPADVVPGVIAAYSEGLRWVWILLISFGGTAFVISLTKYFAKEYKEEDRKVADVEKAGHDEPVGMMA